MSMSAVSVGLSIPVLTVLRVPKLPEPEQVVDQLRYSYAAFRPLQPDRPQPDRSNRHHEREHVLDLGLLDLGLSPCFPPLPYGIFVMR